MSDKNIRGSNRGHYSNRGSNRGYYGNRGSWRGRWSGGGQWSRGRGWRGRGQPQQRGTAISRGTQDTSQPPPAKRPHLIQTTLTVCPYTHWKTYLPTESTYLSIHLFTNSHFYKPLTYDRSIYLFIHRSIHLSNLTNVSIL